jgi:CBS-domain-containing membrane protein
VSAATFLVAYVVVWTDPALAALLGWGIEMTTRQSGHFFFEPRGYDEVNDCSHDHKEEIKVGYNLARKVVLMDRSSKATPVRDIMSKAVRFVRPDQSTDDCMALMTERRMRHLPVIENDRLVGMVSIGDLVKNIIAEQQFTIQQLEFYIHGERP